MTLALCEWPRTPRRVADIEYNLFIIGYWYQCTQAQCLKCYKSWSPSIIKSLPGPVAVQFKFHLTHCSGLSHRIVALMRLCFQRGMGLSPFEALIRTLHRRFYKDLVIQYYEQVKIHYESASIQMKLLAVHSHFGAIDNCNGYADYVPSGQFFRGFFNNFIESHVKEMDQQMVILSADILQIDHSFKVCQMFPFGPCTVAYTTF